jgi:hypothetical protein
VSSGREVYDQGAEGRTTSNSSPLEASPAPAFFSRRVHACHVPSSGETLRQLILDPTRDYQPRGARKVPNDPTNENDVPEQV